MALNGVCKILAGCFLEVARGTATDGFGVARQGKLLRRSRRKRCSPTWTLQGDFARRAAQIEQSALDQPSLLRQLRKTGCNPVAPISGKLCCCLQMSFRRSDGHGFAIRLIQTENQPLCARVNLNADSYVLAV